MNTTVISKNLSVFDRISVFFAGIADNRRRYSQYRQTLRELDSLNDRELNDLGLHRAMIEQVSLDAAYGK